MDVFALNENYEEIERLKNNEKLKDDIALHCFNYWKYLSMQKLCDRTKAFEFFLNDEKTKISFVDSIEREIFQMRGKKILDIGCGKGGVAIACGLKGAIVYGFDTDRNEISIAKKRIETSGINDVFVFISNAEKMPFQDNYFDLVTVTGVLEHVNNLEKVIKEIIRVVKPGGYCYITTPNPFYPREGHYKIFYIPFLPKKIGEIYLKLRGFNPDFFMKYVTYPYPSFNKINRIFEENGTQVQNITERDILVKLKDPQLIKNRLISNIIKFINKLRLHRFMVKCIHFSYSGIFIIARKRGFNEHLR